MKTWAGIRVKNRSSTISEIRSVFLDLDKFVLTTHKFPDGDALGSVVSLYTTLSESGKEVEVHLTSKIGYQYGFMDPDNLILKENEAELEGKILVALDCGDINRLDVSDEMISAASMLINIDHHNSNSYFGAKNLVDVRAPSTTEILFRLLKEDYNISLRSAYAMYAGLVFDTGRFQNSNTTPQAHMMAAHLIKMGVNPHMVSRNLYENNPYNCLSLFSRAISRTEHIPEIGFIYTYVKQDDLVSLGLELSAIENLIDSLRGIKDVELAAVFKETDCGYRISMRSTGRVDAALIALKYGGGGHKMAAGFESKKNMEEIIADIKSHIFDQLKSVDGRVIVT